MSFFEDSSFTADGTHGAEVAGIILASKDENGMHGVAPDASARAYRFIGNDYSEYTANNSYEAAAIAYADALENSVAVMNNSWSVGATSGDLITIEDLSTQAQAEAFLGTNFYNALLDADNNDLISVFSAGNNSGGAPSFLAGLGYLDPRLEDSIIGVVSHDQEDNLSSFSACGEAKHVCIAAPGQDIITINPNATSGTTHVDGTSYSAAFVTGSIALLKSRWPELTNKQVLGIIKDSARDIGASGIDDVFGVGALDISAAMAPIGVVAQNATQEENILNSTISGSAAIVTPIKQALSGSNFIAFDEYDRDFEFNTSALIGSSATSVDRLAYHQFSDLKITDEFSVSLSDHGAEIKQYGKNSYIGFGYTDQFGAALDHHLMMLAQRIFQLVFTLRQVSMMGQLYATAQVGIAQASSDNVIRNIKSQIGNAEIGVRQKIGNTKFNLSAILPTQTFGGEVTYFDGVQTIAPI